MTASVVAAGAALVLAGWATWILTVDSPLSIDDALALALLGFLFVAFLTLLLVSGQALAKLLQGQGRHVLGWAVPRYLLGLLAAALVASPPLLWSWLTNAVPGIRDLPWAILWLLLGAALSVESAWRRAREGGSSSRWLVGFMALPAAASLGLAVRELTEGGTLRGALYLAAALLFGAAAVLRLAGIRKRRSGGGGNAAHRGSCGKIRAVS